MDTINIVWHGTLFEAHKGPETGLTIQAILKETFNKKRLNPIYYLIYSYRQQTEYCYSIWSLTGENPRYSKIEQEHWM